jgi:hypothetical protein
MLLYHLTSCESRMSIERDGFARQPKARLPDLVSFSADQSSHVRFVAVREWWVIVDLPDADAEHARSPAIGAFLVPVEEVNAYQPFRYERHDDHRCYACRDLPQTGVGQHEPPDRDGGDTAGGR